jgi:hypothetical protein
MESRNRAIPDDSTARYIMHELLHPTPYADVNAVLHEFLIRIQAILGEHLRGMYLSGSLALGDFDPRSSDLDVVVVTDEALSHELFVALQQMHARFDTSGFPWAAKVDAVYLPQEALRHSAPTLEHYPQIEWPGPLFLGPLESGWIFQCSILREHGIVLAGPDPRALIDPIDADEMRRAVGTIPLMWLEQAHHDPSWLVWLQQRREQAFVVLTLCRLLYTLDSGAVTSKPAAARWAEKVLGPRWSGLIERSLAGQVDGGDTLEGDVNDTVALLQQTVDRFRQWSTSPADPHQS